MKLEYVKKNLTNFSTSDEIEALCERDSSESPKQEGPLVDCLVWSHRDRMAVLERKQICTLASVVRRPVEKFNSSPKP
jgi:hypothetical protein